MFKGMILSTALALLALPSLTYSNVGQNQFNVGPADWIGTTLTWTAPGDDGNVGFAHQYDIRYSTSYITEDNWEYATRVEVDLPPRLAGCPQRFDVKGLVEGQVYYFALKSTDASGNWSPLSNVYRTTATFHDYCCGDVDLSGTINLSDITSLIGYVFLHNPEPPSTAAADVDGSGDGRITLADITHLIGFLYIHSAEPLCPD